MSLLLRRTPLLARLPLLARAASSSSASTSTSTPAPLSLQAQEPAPAQSPNVATPWSADQAPKSAAFADPRFEQTDYGLQPDGLSAMGLVAEAKVMMVKGRTAVCNGGEWCGGVSGVSG